MNSTLTIWVKAMSLKLAGRKLGMTKFFDENGNLIVCTVLHVEPNVVTQVKSKDSDGYDSIQIGGISVPDSRKKNISKPLQGHFASKKVEPKKVLFESRLESSSEYQAGQEISLELFDECPFVDVIAMSKGKGYQGVMRRHGFKGGPSAHGSGFHRHAGSTGMRSTPGRTFPGLKMPGHMGHEKVTQEGLVVVKVDKERNLLLVKGAVPGAKNSIVYVRKSLKKVINKKRK